MTDLAFWHGFVSSDWNTGIQHDGSSNWGTKPPGQGATPTDVPVLTAEFPVNALNFEVTLSQNTAIANMLFDAGVPQYTFDLRGLNLEIDGLGIVNPLGNPVPQITVPRLSALTFENESTAGNSFIGIAFGVTHFKDSSNAGNAMIVCGLGKGGFVAFHDTSNGSNCTIQNIGGGLAIFLDEAQAGSAAITNSASGRTTFSDDSSADRATLDNFLDGGTNFEVGALGGHAVINNIGGFTVFDAGSSADHATITNKPAIAGTKQGFTEFLSRSSAGSATITNDDGNTVFADSSTADKATIVNKADGWTVFSNVSLAGQSTITTEKDGRLLFGDWSTGGSARLITQAGGIVDISGLTADGMTVGSIEGAGTYRLGNKVLLTGYNNLSTEVSGSIEGLPFGTAGEAQGTLVKLGSGTLMLRRMTLLAIEPPGPSSRARHHQRLRARRRHRYRLSSICDRRSSGLDAECKQRRRSAVACRRCRNNDHHVEPERCAFLLRVWHRQRRQRGNHVD
jgi:hypothetical protein